MHRATNPIAGLITLLFLFCGALVIHASSNAWGIVAYTISPSRIHYDHSMSRPLSRAWSQTKKS